LSTADAAFQDKPEDPQENHIPPKVGGIGMQEHGSEEAKRDIPNLQLFREKGEVFHRGFSDG